MHAYQSTTKEPLFALKNEELILTCFNAAQKHSAVKHTNSRKSSAMQHALFLQYTEIIYQCTLQLPQ